MAIHPNSRPRQIRYYDDYCELREGELIERNGSLAYIRDAETGEQGWVPTFYIEGGLRD